MNDGSHPRWTTIVVAAGAAMLFTVACGSSDPASTPTPPDGQTPPDGPASPADDPAALLAAAQEEGTVVWYAALTVDTMERIASDFHALTGINVDAVRLGGEEVYSRIMQEASSNVTAADVVLASNEGHMVSFKEEGLLAPYVSAEHEHISEGFFDADHAYYAPYSLRFVLSYNTDLLDEADAPTSYDDLLDPRHRGQIVLAHPAFGTGGLLGPYVWLETLGEDYLEALADQDVLVLAGGGDARNALLAGERTIQPFVDYGNVFTEQAAGSPIAPIFQEEGVPEVKAGVGILADSPNPNAAKVFLDYLLSQPAQQVIADINRYAARTDVTYADGFVSDLDVVVIDTNDMVSKAEATVETFENLFETS